MVWTYHEERPGVRRKKGDRNGVAGKRKRERPKRRSLDVVKEDMGKVDAREKDIVNRTLWRSIIRCG